MKCVVTDSGHTARDEDTRERGTGIERVVTDSGHAVRNGVTSFDIPLWIAN